jgi:DNA invertase Pin-like site-specific DNA recombinase
MSAWIYARVSTEDQAIEGYSLLSQERSGRSYCASRDWDLGLASNYDNPGVFADPGVSAWKVPIFERGGFRDLWRNVKRGDRIIFSSLDRGFRSVRDFTGTYPLMSEAGVSPVFIRDGVDLTTATGRLVAHVCAAFAEYTSDIFSETLKERHRLKRMRSVSEEELQRSERTGPWLPRQSPNATLSELSRRSVRVRRSDRVARRVFGYVRVSRTGQSIETQSARISRMKSEVLREHPGCEDGGTYVDHGVSAYCVDWDRRPEGRKLWEELREGDMVVVIRVDRAFRSIWDMAARTRQMTDGGIWLKTGCGIDTTSLAGLQAVEILGMLATWDSRIRGERLSAGIRLAQEKRGPWLTWKNAPHFMTPEESDGGWTFVLTERKYRELRDVLRLRRRGLGYHRISHAMERKLSLEQNRAEFPNRSFTQEEVMPEVYSSSSAEVAVNTLSWFAGQRIYNRKGYRYNREWSWRRVRNVFEFRRATVDHLLAAHCCGKSSRARAIFERIQVARTSG